MLINTTILNKGAWLVQMMNFIHTYEKKCITYIGNKYLHIIFYSLRLTKYSL